MEEKDWLSIEVYHERYMFSTIVHFHPSMTIEEVKKECGDARYEKYSDEIYICDSSSRRDDLYIDAYTSGVEVFSPSMTAIISFEALVSMGEHEFVWGLTNNKYGLLDIKKG